MYSVLMDREVASMYTDGKLSTYIEIHSFCMNSCADKSCPRLSRLHVCCEHRSRQQALDKQDNQISFCAVSVHVLHVHFAGLDQAGNA